MTIDRLFDGEAQYAASQLNIEYTLQFLTPADRELCISLFKNKGAVTRRLFEESIPGFMTSLELSKASYAVKRDCVFKLGEMNTRFGSIVEYRQFFSGVIHIFNEVGRQGLVCDLTLLTVVLDSANKYSHAFVVDGDEYPAKLLRSSLAYARDSKRSVQKVHVELNPAATEEINSLGASILQTVRRTATELSLSPRSGEITTQKTNGMPTEVQSEFFTSEQGAEYVRVGKLFFIDSKYKDQLPPEIMQYAESNVIFVTDMHDTELSDRLGYYTANTIASLMNTDIAGKVVLDCGAGSGLLSLVALKLGAAAVLGVEYDAELVDQARENAVANNYENDARFTILQSDLRDVNMVVERLANTVGDDKEVVVVTNIGSWGNYPITNMTCYSYIPVINSIPELSVSKVISGGYSHGGNESMSANEAEFLNEIGMDSEQLPTDAKQRDIAVLLRVGSHLESETVSQKLQQPASFSHEASSIVMSS